MVPAGRVLIANVVRNGAAISVAALVVVSCGGAPPPAPANGGCNGVWRGPQCVQEVVVGDAPVTTTPAPDATSPPAVTTPPPAPTNAAAIARARDPRMSRLRPRALPLLVTELQQIEALATATPDSQPDKPLLLRRLAEDYVELETAATAAGREAIVTSSRRAAMKHYDALIGGFSAYSLLDEARYFDALEHERAGDLSGARRIYLDVVTHHPTSKYVPYAYFAFGEMFAGEGAHDPSRLDVALEAYKKSAASPPPTNGIYGWAWLRIGNVEEQKGSAAEARDAYAKAREFATTYAQIQGAADLLAAIPP